jgi:uncharacterized membrane protein
LADWLGNRNLFPAVVTHRKKRSLLPVLTVVFLASYGLMTLLIVEQGEAIQSQRNLIQVLLRDSRELWAARKAQTENNAPSQTQTESGAQMPSPQSPSTRGPAPSRQAPSTQTVTNPSNQTPSNQAEAQHLRNGAGKANAGERIPQTQIPPMPASDWGDQRRELITL